MKVMQIISKDEIIQITVSAGIKLSRVSARMKYFRLSAQMKRNLSINKDAKLIQIIS